MKKLVHVIALTLLTSGTVFAQTQKDFIRNYKAPDFKLRMLNFSMDGASSGIKTRNFTDTTGNIGFSGGGNLMYYKISNSAKYQGITRSTLNASGGINRSDGNGFSNSMLAGNFNYDARFFIQPKFFIRAVSLIGFRGDHFSSNIDFVDDQTSMNFNASLQGGVGYGRIEYSNFARKAMDIEFLLKMGDRASQDFTTEELTKIADNLARVNYKRGFDFRLLRIWRLEQMDSIMGGLDVVTKRDMRYMAFLNDAMLYSPSLGRLSGATIETGGSHRAAVFQVNSPTYDRDILQVSSVYVRYAHYIPTSYAFQHNIFAGYTAFRNLDVDEVVSFEGQLFGRYEFGWYPNTRTALVANANLSSTDREKVNESASLSFGLDWYYYITPRSRLNVTSNIGGAIFDNNEFFDGSSDFSLGYNLGFRFTHAIF